MKVLKSHAVRLFVLLLLSGLALQLFFLARIAAMRWVDPQSTTFQRSEIWRLVSEQHQLRWSQQWVPYEQIADTLKRAVITSEDAGFVDHSGVEWDAIEKAWTRNQLAEARADKLNETRLRREEQATARRKADAAASARAPQRVQPKVVGGSTISQQLAKNLLPPGERTTLRKGQELLVTLMLEATLPKSRILEIYLNNVEWGEGLFGAQAAARHYFHIDAARLGAHQAARLAVMLPAPKRFEKRPDSAYVLGRSATVAARMGAVELP
jgi:monofunctional glycosyltransferase